MIAMKLTIERSYDRALEAAQRIQEQYPDRELEGW